MAHQSPSMLSNCLRLLPFGSSASFPQLQRWNRHSTFDGGQRLAFLRSGTGIRLSEGVVLATDGRSIGFRFIKFNLLRGDGSKVLNPRFSREASTRQAPSKGNLSAREVSVLRLKCTSDVFLG